MHPRCLEGNQVVEYLSFHRDNQYIPTMHKPNALLNSRSQLPAWRASLHTRVDAQSAHSSLLASILIQSRPLTTLLASTKVLQNLQATSTLRNSQSPRSPLKLSPINIRGATDSLCLRCKMAPPPKYKEGKQACFKVQLNKYSAIIWIGQLVEHRAPRCQCLPRIKQMVATAATAEWPIDSNRANLFCQLLRLRQPARLAP